MTNRKSKFKSATEILDERFFQEEPELDKLLAEEEANAEVAGLIYRARMKAGLTQQALADRVGTTKSVISRLEDADYRGHSLAMLRRIGKALGYRVRVEFESRHGTLTRSREGSRDRGQTGRRSRGRASLHEATRVSEIHREYKPQKKEHGNTKRTQTAGKATSAEAGVSRKGRSKTPQNST